VLSSQAIGTEAETWRRESLPDRIERIGRALTADELAYMLTVSRIMVFKQAKAGRIPSFRIGSGVRLDPKTVAQWLRAM
jgi:excisionase family DNA binding protein